MLDSRESNNLDLVESLNQRGGRMLSLVDLLAAKSLSLEMAAYLLARIRGGASFLTAAKPGAAGKTAVMGALLGCLPPGATIRIVSSAHELQATGALAAPVWHVCHELGAGRIPGYLWGEALPPYFGLLGTGNYLASNLHADTLPEIRRALGEPPNSLTDERLAQVDLVLTLRMEGGQRWVSSILASDGQEHREVFRHNPRQQGLPLSDACPVADDCAGWAGFLEKLVRDDVRPLADFRAQLLACHNGV